MHLGNVRHNTLKEIWNNDAYKALRKNMLSGERSQSCRACYAQEDNGVKSFRQSLNEEFLHLIPLKDTTNYDGSLDSLNLKYLDVRWSNICNFKCRSCSSTYSSSLAKEEGKENIYILAGGESNNDLFDQFRPYLLDIERFYFAGGEPLLTDKHYDILNYLIKNNKTDVEIRYNTNLSNLTYKKTNIIDLWKNFSNVRVSVSLDSWGTRAEYIREGTVWKDIENNIRSIRDQAPHVYLDNISSVSSIFNVLTMTDFYEYLIETGLFDIDKFSPSVFNIQNPRFYSYTVLPDDLKAIAIEKLKSKSFNDSVKIMFDDILNTLESVDYSYTDHKNFLEHTKKYDSLRNRSFLNTFPELNKLWVNF